MNVFFKIIVIPIVVIFCCAIDCSDSPHIPDKYVEYYITKYVEDIRSFKLVKYASYVRDGIFDFDHSDADEYSCPIFLEGKHIKKYTEDEIKKQKHHEKLAKKFGDKKKIRIYNRKFAIIDTIKSISIETIDRYNNNYGEKANLDNMIKIGYSIVDFKHRTIIRFEKTLKEFNEQGGAFFMRSSDSSIEFKENPSKIGKYRFKLLVVTDKRRIEQYIDLQWDELESE